MLWVPINSKTCPKSAFWHLFGSKVGEKKVGIQALGPPRRDPGRNSASDPGLHVPNGGMATHLVVKRCDLGSLRVPNPASTPLGRRGRATSNMDPKLDLDLDISDLGFDQISSYKRGDLKGWAKGFCCILPPSICQSTQSLEKIRVQVQSCSGQKYVTREILVRVSRKVYRSIWMMSGQSAKRMHRPVIQHGSNG